MPPTDGGREVAVVAELPDGLLPEDGGIDRDAELRARRARERRELALVAA